MNQELFSKQIVNKTTREELIVLLGNPRKELKSDMYTFLIYSSNAPTLTDIFYFKGNTLVRKSRSTAKEKILLETFFQKYGLPEKGKIRFSDGGDLNYAVYMWPTQGITITAMGNLPNSLVLRIDEYEPTSLENYFEKWDKNLLDNKEVTVSGQIVTTKPNFYSSPIIFLIPILLSVLILGVFIRRKIMKKKKEKDEISPMNIHY